MPEGYRAGLLWTNIALSEKYISLQYVSHLQGNTGVWVWYLQLVTFREYPDVFRPILVMPGNTRGITKFERLRYHCGRVLIITSADWELDDLMHEAPRAVALGS